MMATFTPQPLAETQKQKWISWRWTLIVTAVVMTFFLWECGSALIHGRSLANVAVRHFHQELNTGDYTKICQEADSRFTQSQDTNDVTKFLQAVHKKLGSAGTENLVSLNVSSTTNGTFVVTRYNTTFDAGQAQETFTWLKSGNTLRLTGYNVQSNVFVLK
jgi:hypothetical protein